MITMGIDLSLRETGFAVLEDGKSVERAVISAQSLGTARLILIEDEVVRHVDLHRPDQIAIEAVAYGSMTAVDSAELHGTVRTALYRLGHKDIIYVAPPTLKKFATGSGRAQKSDIKLELLKRWKITERNDNKADAYVLARIAGIWCGSLEPENKQQRECMASIRTTTDKKEGRIPRFKKRKIKETA